MPTLTKMEPTEFLCEHCQGEMWLIDSSPQYDTYGCEDCKKTQTVEFNGYEPEFEPEIKLEEWNSRTDLQDMNIPEKAYF